VEKLKNEGWKVYALEEDARAIEISNQVFINTENCLLILGSEVTGVDADLLSLCDQIFYIPMQGEKRSLNVSIAFSIAAFVLGK
ncbi:MAG TPA: RNA methyltransferase, partial [Anaerolineae bacterium]|nr:RNA methyltransferase [Anaerolineae bacterium]